MSESGRLKAVLVGCGSMAKAWMNVATRMDEVEVAALVDIRPEAAEAMARAYELPESVVRPTLSAAIEATKPDLVFDVTIPAAHDAVTIEALEAGCHVLGEKPMAESMDKARRMVAAAREADRLYAVIQNRRYAAPVRRVTEVVRNGALGQLDEMHCDFYLGPHFGGFRDEMDHPLLVDMAIHTFDQARMISNADPLAVYCHAFNPGRSWYRGDASAVCIFEMSDGLVYTYRGSWCAEGLNTSWQAQWRIIGRHGTLLWDGDDNIEAAVHKRDAEGGFMREMEPLAIPDAQLEHQGHAGLIHEFVDCVRMGKRPLTHCEDNIKSLAMVFAAVKSAETGRREKVEW